MAAKNQKYNNEYICGFTITLNCNGTEKPPCFLCGKVLANCSMKPVKLKEHLHVSYLGNISNSHDTFLQKKVRFERSRILEKHGFISTGQPLLEASYNVVYQIAKDKSHSALLKH